MNGSGRACGHPGERVRTGDAHRGRARRPRRPTGPAGADPGDYRRSGAGGQQVGGEGEGGDAKPDRVDGEVGDAERQPGDADADADGQDQAEPRAGGELLGGGRGHDEQGEHEQAPVIWLASAAATPNRNRNTTDRHRDRHAAGGGHVGVDRGKEQRPPDRRPAPPAPRPPTSEQDQHLAVGDPEEGAEEQRGRSVRGSPCTG